MTHNSSVAHFYTRSDQATDNKSGALSSSGRIIRLQYKTANFRHFDVSFIRILDFALMDARDGCQLEVGKIKFLQLKIKFYKIGTKQNKMSGFWIQS